MPGSKNTNISKGSAFISSNVFEKKVERDM